MYRTLFVIDLQNRVVSYYDSLYYQDLSHALQQACHKGLSKWDRDNPPLQQEAGLEFRKGVSSR